MGLDLERIVRTIKETTNNEFEVFKSDINQDELEELESYFIYKPYGDIRKISSAKTEFHQDFFLMFVTTNKTDLNPFIFELAKNLRKCSLRFNSSSRDEGILKNTDKKAEMWILDFHEAIQCIGLSRD